MSFRPPDKDPPLVESDPTFSLPLVTFEAQPQDASSVSYFYPWLPFPYMLPQGPGQPHDGADAFQPLGSLVHPGDASQYLPPEAVQSADPALDVQAVETPGGGEGGALPFCETCNLGFGRRQEFKRHMEQGHQPRRQCPFNPCAYKWKRPDKIKAHITNKHRSELCPKVFKNVSALRGKRIVEFINAYEFAYNFGTPAEPCVLLSLPPLARSENFMLSEYCGCCLGSGDIFSSEGVVEQTVEESTVLPEGM